MSGHTPGPWEFVPFEGREGSPNEGDMGGFRHGGYWICHFGDSEQYYPSEGKSPNAEDARLISAAPELLALKMAVLQNGHDMLMTGEELRECALAIAKATGAQP